MATRQRGLSPAAALVRRHDPDRFLATLFAPAPLRERLFLLYAFNHELARAREVTREPGLALIRLHWWREVTQGARRRHELAWPLGEAIDRGELPADRLAALVDAREAEADGAMARLVDWLGYLRDTAGALAEVAGVVLGADPVAAARLRDLGTGYGIAGQLRNVAALARQGRCLLPADVLAGHGLDAARVIHKPNDPGLRPVLEDLAAPGRKLLRNAGGGLPRPLVAAALPSVLGLRDLTRLTRARPIDLTAPRGLSDKLAVVAAWLTSTV